MRAIGILIAAALPVLAAVAAQASETAPPPEIVPGPLRPLGGGARDPATEDRGAPVPAALPEPAQRMPEMLEGPFLPGAPGEKAGGRAIARTAVHDLRLEKLSVTPGRDLELWLVAVDRIADRVDLAETKHVSLGRLKKAEGDQTYRLPPEIDLRVYRMAVVWSRRERAARAAALLAPAAAVAQTGPKRPRKR